MKLLKLDSTGAPVATLQRQLNTLGFGTRVADDAGDFSFRPLVDDGHFGPLTLSAVLDFQEEQGLHAGAPRPRARAHARHHAGVTRALVRATSRTVSTPRGSTPCRVPGRCAQRGVAQSVRLWELTS